MTATTIPSELAAHRQRGMQKTGLRGGAWGIAPDEDHKRGGGYHCGVKDCQNIGKFHPPPTANIGSRTEDYSVRQYRDRTVGGNAASAEDIGGDWPNGGRAAWLRFNRMLVKQLQKGDRALRAVREVNFTPDGTARKRWDALHPDAGVNGDGIVPSTDTAETHTHVGFWRDTAGTPARAEALARIEQIIDAAIVNRSLENTEEDEDMGQTFTDQIPSYEELEGRAHTFSPGLVGGGTADPRDTWVSFGADTYGTPIAIRAMQTNGVKDSAGNVAWAPVFGADVVVLASGERKGEQLKQGTVFVSVSHMVVDPATGKAVKPDAEKDIVPAWDGRIAVLIERGQVKR
jgi:hypothetical protein